MLITLLYLALSGFGADNFSKNDFPTGFIFGSGTSAYQVEGAANEDGRTPSVWDTFAHAGNVHGGTGDIACDQYHKYKEDVQLMVDTGLDAYRFSISWSRLIPNGRGPVNPKGVQYYNNLINELISHGIKPHVTLYNYDHPQALEDEYGGWINRTIVKDFTTYADVCFREFGDRVLYWTTINEPNVFAIGGYDTGIVPPKRCSPPFGTNCDRGNSTFEPYVAVRHILLAHALTRRLYKNKYQGKQHGYIGVSIYAPEFVPLTNSTEDVIASERAYDFFVGWIANPLVFGDYPYSMKKNIGSRLPMFSSRESKLVKGSFDFLGVISYYTLYVKDNSRSLKQELRDFDADMAVKVFWQFNASSYELPIQPLGLQGVLKYFKQVYGNPPIYIQENGLPTPRNSSLDDMPRVEFLHANIGSVLDAVRNGSDVRGYFTWSFMDVFELLDGYESRYGLYYVDFDNSDLKRYPKLSAHWYSQFLKGRSTIPDTAFELEKELSASSDGHCLR